MPPNMTASAAADRLLSQRLKLDLCFVVVASASKCLNTAATRDLGWSVLDILEVFAHDRSCTEYKNLGFSEGGARVSCACKINEGRSTQSAADVTYGSSPAVGQIWEEGQLFSMFNATQCLISS